MFLFNTKAFGFGCCLKLGLVLLAFGLLMGSLGFLSSNTLGLSLLSLLFQTLCFCLSGEFRFMLRSLSFSMRSELSFLP